VPDVVIAGYGPAGAAAAIAAHDAGRSVLILESAERGGGNARYSRCDVLCRTPAGRTGSGVPLR
jgi:thioredoxin reductase